VETTPRHGPAGDGEVAAFAQDLGIPGLFDIHVHFMPDRMQQAVWRHFDGLPVPWGIRYRTDDATRVRTLRTLGVRRYTALAYAHKPGMAAWLNEFTLSFAEQNPAAVASFTFFPEAAATADVDAALARGGRVAKVHLQVSKFDPLDPLLATVWERLQSSATPVVIHAGAVPDGSGGEQWCGMDPVRRLLRHHPGLVLVLAHLGAPDYEDAVRLAGDFPQLLMDTAMTLVDEGGFEYPRVLMNWLEASPRRVLFGSDFPTFPHDYAAQVRGLAIRGFGDDWLRRVLWQNAAGILGL
jgi:predicted TIM-barrel fold metal-dependent hydrolase